MKDNKLEFIITHENPNRLDVVDAFLNCTIMLATESIQTRKYIFKIIRNIPNDIKQLSSEEYKRDLLTEKDNILNYIFNLYGKDLEGKSLKLSLEFINSDNNRHE